MSASARAFDVAVIGAGPAGAVAALAHARRGARVLLLEANPRGAQRLAGEWLHPPALAALSELGIELEVSYPSGRGFAVFPDTGEERVLLPYAEGLGLSAEHSRLVSSLREAAAAHTDVLYLPDARVVEIDGQRLEFRRKGRGTRVAVRAERIVGADGRSSFARSRLGPTPSATPASCMAGVLLRDVELPDEGYGHVFLGGPGPALCYRVAPDRVRLILDLPPGAFRPRARGQELLDGFGPVLPAALREALREALSRERILWSPVPVRTRRHYGRPGLALVGDAVGNPHPLTAVGMTLGIGDAVALAKSRSFRAYRLRRTAETRVPELLAAALYDVFSDDAADASAIRRAVFALWRRDPRERARTLGYLAAQNRSVPAFTASFVRVAASAASSTLRDAASARSLGQGLRVARELIGRTLWLGAAALRPRPPRLLEESAPSPRPDAAPERASSNDAPAGRLGPAITNLLRHQREDGSWEGEVVWCPMLAAQYVMMCHLTGTPIPEQRRDALLLHFRRTQQAGGLWGLHELSEPYLFVTALVYVAARLLGVSAGDPLLQPARAFLEREGGVVAIPSWGKFWLAMLGLYDWRGVNAVLPELWALPRWLPVHPSKLYCHTRLIYLAMGAIYGRKLRAPDSALLASLRAELHPDGYERVDFEAARTRLRSAEIHTPPSRLLRAIFRLSGLFDRVHPRRLRERVLSQLGDRIRWELRTTDHTSISPVSGMLNMIALWSESPDDPDWLRAREQLEGWFWEDAKDGARIAGARSASWDTAFAVSALAAAAPVGDAARALERGAAFLRSQQIRESFPGYREAFRLDPRGGWCFAGVWHGWPVSDCTAEAVTALLRAGQDAEGDGALREAARFMLRCQNPDGGFGSYEARRTRLDLERINPAEMFGDSMSDHSWVECTASCLEALAALAERPLGEELLREIAVARDRAARWLRHQQRADGSWQGVWGVHFVYGTLFGVRGLRAAGAAPGDPSLRRACRWLRERQRKDGGWGEDARGCLTGSYLEHDESQAIHTAWALLALLEAGDPDWLAIERGARHLARAQLPNGEWPRQDPAGVFFHTALLDYALYRSYFPLWALALYERRRSERTLLAPSSQRAA